MKQQSPNSAARREFDAVVLGSGLAGMCAATAAAEAGARVAVLERSDFIGGSAAMSGGLVWTLETATHLAREDRGQFQRHGRCVVNGYGDIHAFLSRFSAPVTQETRVLGGRGRKFDIPALFCAMANAIQRAGGKVFTGADTTEAFRSSDALFTMKGTVPEGQFEVTGASVVFATGGRQADPAVRKGLTDGSYTPILRGNHFSDGSGQRLAQALGAAVNYQNQGFYGHLFADGAVPVAPLDFIALALYHSGSGVMILRDGSYCPGGGSDHRNAIALAQHGGRAVLLWSEETQRKIPGQTSYGFDSFRNSADRGGRVDSVPDSRELPALFRAWGYGNPAEALDTDNVRGPLGAGRVFAADVRLAVTYTFGGVCANEDGAVLDEHGEIVPGVFVAGSDMADVYHQGYGGGLSAAAYFGLKTGQAAAARCRHYPLSATS